MHHLGDTSTDGALHALALQRSGFKSHSGLSWYYSNNNYCEDHTMKINFTIHYLIEAPRHIWKSTVL